MDEPKEMKVRDYHEIAQDICRELGIFASEHEHLKYDAEVEHDIGRMLIWIRETLIQRRQPEKCILQTEDSHFIMAIDDRYGYVVVVTEGKLNYTFPKKLIASITKMGYWHEVPDERAREIEAIVKSAGRKERPLGGIVPNSPPPQCPGCGMPHGNVLTGPLWHGECWDKHMNREK